MRLGLAKAFKLRYPAYYENYRRLCLDGQILCGRVYTYRDASGTTIISFPTKRSLGDEATLGDVYRGISDLANVVRAGAIRTVAIPALGCGTGGLNYDDVRPLLVRTFATMPHVIAYLYNPR